MNIENEKIIKFVQLALKELYKNDKYLFECDVKEENLVFHFGRYFIELLKQNNFDLDTYSVDFEYNRNIFNEKIYKEIVYENIKHRIIPDLLLHIRGRNDGNIIAFEFKKRYNKNIKIDKMKLKALTDNNLEYKYQIGLLVIFNNGNNFKIITFINGIEVIFGEEKKGLIL